MVKSYLPRGPCPAQSQWGADQGTDCGVQGTLSLLSDRSSSKYEWSTRTRVWPRARRSRAACSRGSRPSCGAQHTAAAQAKAARCWVGVWVGRHFVLELVSNARRGLREPYRVLMEKNGKVWFLSWDRFVFEPWLCQQVAILWSGGNSMNCMGFWDN